MSTTDMVYRRAFVVVAGYVLSACAGLNPNPGERTVDEAWTSRDYALAFNTAKPRAESGEPWAQLRVGIFYENGFGTNRDPQQAKSWYERAIAQKGTGGWSNGQLVGAIGKPGHFNQNSDAIIAEFNLAQMLFKGDGISRDLPKASEHIANVIRESGGKAVFFCCEFEGGRYFTPQQFDDLNSKIDALLIQSDQLHLDVSPDGAHR